MLDEGAIVKGEVEFGLEGAKPLNYGLLKSPFYTRGN